MRIRTLDQPPEPFGRTRFLLTVLVFVLASLLPGPPPARAEVVSLAELEAAALEGHPQLTMDAARVRAAEADVARTKSGRQPRFMLQAESTVGPGRRLLDLGDLTVDYTDSEETQALRVSERYDDYLVQVAPPLGSGRAFTPQLRSGLELSGAARLYDFGRTRAAIQAGEEGTRAARAAQEVTRAELLSAVRHSYLNWLLAHELARLADEARAQAASQRERVQALIRQGVRPEEELSAAQAEELLTQLERQRAQADAGAARLTLERTSGASLGQGAEPDLTLIQDPEPRLQSAAARQRAASERALRQRYRAAMAAVEAERRGQRPDLSASVLAGVSSQLGGGFNAFPLYGAGLTLSVPLWDGGLSRANQMAAEAEAQELRAEIDAFERGHTLDARQADQDLAQAQARLQTAEALIQVAEKRLAVAQRGYDLGATDIIQVGQARALLRRARTEALIARVEQADAQLRNTEGSAAPTR
jgi:outer membrane protein